MINFSSQRPLKKLAWDWFTISSDRRLQRNLGNKSIVNGLQYHDDLGGEKTQKKLMILKLELILQDHNINENSFHQMFHCEICRPNRSL